MVWRGVASATLFAFVLFAGWLRPTRPLWETPGTRAIRVCGFSPDSRIWTMADNAGPSTPPILRRFEARTGKLLSSAEMKCEFPTLLKDIQISPDGQIALVGEGRPWRPDSDYFCSGDLFIHDGITGKRLHGPLEGVRSKVWSAFSECGRYVLAGFPGPGEEPHALSGVALFAAQTGAKLFEVPLPRRFSELRCLFSPDGSKVAFLFKPEKSRWAIQLVSIPDGRPFPQADLAETEWEAFWRWDAEGIWGLVAGRQLEGSRVITPAYFNPNAPDQPAVLIPAANWEQEVDRPGYTAPVYFRFKLSRISRNRIIRCEKVERKIPPSFIPKSLQDWAREKLGWWPHEAHFDVRVLDRVSGEQTNPLSGPIPFPFVVSFDGKLLASARPGGGLMVWDLDPPPRWPWVVGLATLAAGLPWLPLLRRWRSPMLPPVHSFPAPEQERP